MESEVTYTAAINSPPSKRKYTLPYNNSVLSSFLTVAENAAMQAQINRDACARAMTNNENTMSDIMPAFPHMQDNYSPSLVYSTRSLVLSAESAYQAQSSVCEALRSALLVAEEERQKLIQRLSSLTMEIANLDQRAANLRQSFSHATANSPDGTVDVYATEEAKKLLSTLESAYQKHDLNRKIKQHLAETEANLSYLKQSEIEARAYMDNIAKLVQKAQEEWRLVLQVFQVGPEQFQKQTEALSALEEHKKVQAEPQTTTETKIEPEAENAVQEEPQALPEKEAEETSAETSGSSFLFTLWSYVKIILVAFLIAFVLRAYVFDLTVVDGTSMDPTLEDEDKLITGKANYYFSDPQRGDIVVLNAPDMPGHDYIKRIIGLPNERITIQDGKVYINGEQLIESYLADMPTYGDIDMVIPDGYYFVMGDNRTDSRDGREEKIGVISKDAINGKAVFRLLPFNRIGTIY